MDEGPAAAEIDAPTLAQEEALVGPTHFQKSRGGG